MVLVVPPEPPAGPAPVAGAPADLQGEPFVAFDHDLTIRKAIDRALRQHNVKRRAS